MGMELQELIEKCRFPEHIDSTMLTTADACKQKFFNEFVLCITPHGKSIDLHAGGAFALAMELIRKEFYNNKTPIEECYKVVLPKFAKFWGDFEPPFNHQKDFVNVWGAVLEYFREYPPTTDLLQPYRSPNGDLGVEYTFAIPMEVMHPETGLPLLFCGRFDMLAHYANSPNELMIVDEKTTKALGASWPRQWNLRGQFLGYTYAVRSVGLECAGALIRGIAIQKTQYKHMQCLVQHSQWQLERWWKRSNSLAEQLANHYIRMKDYDTIGGVVNSWTHSYGEACSAYGGCHFSEIICSTPEPWLWYNSFDTRVWDPLHKDPTHEAEIKPTETIIIHPEDMI